MNHLRLYKFYGSQPPLRGCVLKLLVSLRGVYRQSWQPPLRGCVLKPSGFGESDKFSQMQPPLRGCVLKLLYLHVNVGIKKAAASARLCVETTPPSELNRPNRCSRLRAAVC